MSYQTLARTARRLWPLGVLLLIASCDEEAPSDLIRPSFAWLHPGFEARYEILANDGADPVGTMTWRVFATRESDEFRLEEVRTEGAKVCGENRLIRRTMAGLQKQYASACPDSHLITEWDFEPFLPSPLDEGYAFNQYTCLGVVRRHWTVLYVDHVFESQGRIHTGFVMLRQGWDADQSLYYYGYDEGLIRIERRDGHWDGSWYRFDPSLPIRELTVLTEPADS